MLAVTAVVGRTNFAAFLRASDGLDASDAFFLLAAARLGAPCSPEAQADLLAAARAQDAPPPAPDPAEGARGVPFARLTDALTVDWIRRLALGADETPAIEAALAVVYHPRVSRVHDRPLVTLKSQSLAISSRDAVYLLTHVVFVCSAYGGRPPQAPPAATARWLILLRKWLAFLHAKPARLRRNAEVLYEVISCVIILEGAQSAPDLPALARASLTDLLARVAGADPASPRSPFRTGREPGVCRRFEDWHTHATAAHALALFSRFEKSHSPK